MFTEATIEPVLILFGLTLAATLIASIVTAFNEKSGGTAHKTETAQDRQPAAARQQYQEDFRKAA